MKINPEIEPRKAQAIVHDTWQPVLFHGVYPVGDEHYRDVMAVVETKSGKIRKVPVHRVELEIDDNQIKMFE